MTHNQTFLKIKQKTQNHCSILKKIEAVEKTLSIEPIIAFRKNKSLKQRIRGNTIQNDKIIRKPNNIYEAKSKSTPCKSGIR